MFGGERYRQSRQSFAKDDNDPASASRALSEIFEYDDDEVPNKCAPLYFAGGSKWARALRCTFPAISIVSLAFL